MNLPSTEIHLEVAKVGEQYVMRLTYTNGPGSVGGSVTDVIGSRESLTKHLGVLVNYVPQ